MRPRSQTASRFGSWKPPAGKAACGSSTGTTFASASIFRPRSFNRAILRRRLASVLKDTGFSPLLLELEVTENILLEDDEAALETFQRIQELGVHIAFDDFGTGYASLTYLKKFPLDRLKIDQSFVRDIRADSDDAAIVGSTINLGKLLGLSVIAEGIEDRRHCRYVEAHGMRGRAGVLFRPADAGRGV